MNLKFLAAAAALTATLSLGLAQEDGKKGKGPRPDGKGGDPAERAEAMIKRLDKDGDGKLSKEEFAAGPMAERVKDDPEQLDRLFARLDKDGDGKLSQEELAATPVRGKGRPGAKGEGKGPRPEGSRPERPEGKGPRPEGDKKAEQ